MNLMGLEEITQNLTTADRSLLYHILVQLQETNRLLTQLVEQPKEAEAVNIDDLNRQELMKAIAKLPNNPKGWNKWQTEDMRNYLKGEQK